MPDQPDLSRKLTQTDRVRAVNSFYINVVRHRAAVLLEYAAKVSGRRIPADLRPMADATAEFFKLVTAQLSQAQTLDLLANCDEVNAVRRRVGIRARTAITRVTIADLVAKAVEGMEHVKLDKLDHRGLVQPDTVDGVAKTILSKLPAVQIQKVGHCSTKPLGMPLLNAPGAFVCNLLMAGDHYGNDLPCNDAAAEVTGRMRDLLTAYTVDEPKQLTQAFREEAFRAATFRDLTMIWPAIASEERVICYRAPKAGDTVIESLPSAFSVETRAALRSLAAVLPATV